VLATSDAVGEGAKQISELFEDADVSILDPEQGAEFRKSLDVIEDKIAADTSDSVNKNLLDIEIPRIVEELTIGGEDAEAVIKGNLLEGITIDGGGLSPDQSVYSVNGTIVPDILLGDGDGLNFVISTADWNIPAGASRTVTINNGIADFLDLSFADFPRSTLGNRLPTAGSAIRTEITVEAGATLEFETQFGSFDYVPWTDYSFVTVKATEGGTAAEQDGLVLRNSAFGGPDDVRDLKGPQPYNLAGRWLLGDEKTFSYTFEEAGTYTIGIGATDVGDQIIDSVLYASNIRVVMDGETTLLDSFEERGNVQSFGEVNTDISALVITGTYGTLVVTKGGDYIYQPGTDNAAPIPKGATVTDDFTFTIQTKDGQLASQTVSFRLNEAEAVEVGPTDPAEPTDPIVVVATNTNTQEEFATIAAAIEAASDGDNIEIIAGSFDEALVINKSITLSGANAGVSAKFMDGANADNSAITNILAGEDANEARGAETILTGTVTVANAGVTLDGLRLAADTPLDWDLSTLNGGSLDGFTLKNSVIIGYTAAGAPTFNPDSSATPGSYAGETVAANWVISDNMFGGMTSGNAGALYISGVSELELSDNLFWRPSAGHLYLSSLEDAEILDNFFYHGLHAGGANFDGFGEAEENPIGGYGYGYGGYGDGGYGDASFGRNFWIELKGLNDGILIADNDGQFNSGGIQIYGEGETPYSFKNISIDSNTFRDFVNAAPDGLDNGKSGFMGAISVSVLNGTAEGITINGNTIAVAADQIFTINDVPALIQLQGALSGTTTVNNNTLTWQAKSSDEILEGLSALGVAASSYSEAVVALRLLGALSDTVNVTNNTFTAETGVIPQARGVDINGDDDIFGAFSASLNIGFDLGLSGTTMLNSFTGYELDVYLASVPDTLNPNNLSFNLQPGGFAAADYDGDLKELIFGGIEDDNLVASGSGNILFGSLGDDSINISCGGENVVLFHASPDLNGLDTVSGFQLGEGIGADIIEILPLIGLRGDEWQAVASGGTVGENVGFIVYTTPLSEFTLEATGAEFNVNGLIETDLPFFVLATDGTNSGLFRLDGSEFAAPDDVQVAKFLGMDDLTLFADTNIGSFEQYMGT
jgi:VCBS repeat-containing protein